jgi:Aromatic-ring-opening dioxygenase LigAB, LigA subunit
MLKPEDKLQGFVEEARHLTSPLNIVASDMIRDRDLTKKLDDDPDYFIRKYSLTDEQLDAMRKRDLPKLFELGLHPFLVVRFAGMMGILEYWKALGAPGREGYKEN